MPKTTGEKTPKSALERLVCFFFIAMPNLFWMDTLLQGTDKAMQLPVITSKEFLEATLNA